MPGLMLDMADDKRRHFGGMEGIENSSTVATEELRGMKVNIRKGMIRGGFLPIQQYVAIVCGESSNNFEEAEAIGSVY